MRRFWPLVFVALSGSALAVGSADYAYTWPLATEGNSGAYQVELSPEIYAAISDSNLRDVEIFNSEGAAVPLAPVPYDSRVVWSQERFELPLFVLPRATTGASPDDVHLHIERGVDGKLRQLEAQVTAAPAGAPTADVLLDASAIKSRIDSLWLRWKDSGASVDARYAVEASEDLENWRLLVPAAAIIDLHQGDATLTRRQIPLNSTATYLRLRRMDNGAALTELNVVAHTASQSTLTRPPQLWLDAELVREETRHLDRPNDGTSKQIVGYTYRLPAALNVEVARLELVSDNSIAQVSLLSRLSPGDGLQHWQQRGQFSAFRLNQDGQLLANEELPIGAAPRAQEWRLECWQPLDRAPKLYLAYRPDRFVFLARGAGPYTLAAGNRKAQRPEYPVNTALSQLRGRLGADWQPPLARIQARQTVLGDAATAMPVVAAERPWKTWLLWGVLVVAAGVVIGLALSLLRGSSVEK